jgi:type I restriction enzyme M protein
MRIEEFEPEKKWWGKRKESEQAWKVSAKDIAANGYNLDIKNPNAVVDGVGDPDVLLKEFKALSAEVAKIQEKLKKELGKALESAS